MALREVTNKILDAMEDGSLDAETVARACLGYMSEAEVADMADTNDLLFVDLDPEAE